MQAADFIMVDSMTWTREFVPFTLKKVRAVSALHCIAGQKCRSTGPVKHKTGPERKMVIQEQLRACKVTSSQCSHASGRAARGSGRCALCAVPWRDLMPALLSRRLMPAFEALGHTTLSRPSIFHPDRRHDHFESSFRQHFSLSLLLPAPSQPTQPP